MGLFNKKEGGIMDAIRCDEQDFLIWKWKPTGEATGSTNKENTIRWGSPLRVKQGQVAVFMYNTKEGSKQDYIEGAYDEIVKTENLPVLTNIVGLAYAGSSPFQAEVYFINLANIIQVKFGVPYFDVYDPRFMDFGVPIAVRGTMTFKISDYKNFIKLHRLDEFTLDTFEKQIKDVIIKYVKDIVANMPTNNNISVIQLEKKVVEVNEAVDKKVKEHIEKDFGVDVVRFDIGAIDIDKESQGYIQLKSVTQDITTATLKAQAEANIRNIQAQQKDYEEKLRIQREEGQFAQHMQTASQNMGAYQTTKQAEVGVAGAEALGKMGAAGGADMNMGGGGMNMAGMMAGMAMGGAVGQNMAGVFNNMNQGLNNQNASTPPPVMPQLIYHIAQSNGQSVQMDMNGIKENINNGTITKDTLCWKQGMTNWAKAGEIPEVSALFIGGTTPPPIPNNI